MFRGLRTTYYLSRFHSQMKYELIQQQVKNFNILEGVRLRAIDKATVRSYRPNVFFLRTLSKEIRREIYEQPLPILQIIMVIKRSLFG